MTTNVSGPSADATPRKRPFFRPTTADQRKLLFEVYEQTASPRQACAAAHVGMATLYHWRPRFLAGGYAALVEPYSHAPHTFPHQVPAGIVAEVVTAKQEHPDWGRRRIADEVRQDHGWQAVVSASEVRRLLVKAGVWSAVTGDPKGSWRSATPRSPSKR
jgi:transposase